MLQVGKKGTFKLISSVTIGPTGEIIVADTRIRIFSGKGDFIEIMCDETRGKSRYVIYYAISQRYIANPNLEVSFNTLILSYSYR